MSNPSLENIRKISIPFGSRELGVSDSASDYDFATTRNMFFKLFGTNFCDVTDIDLYFSIVPKDGDNFGIFKGITSDGFEYDLLVFEFKSALITIINALKDMKKIPKYLIENKDTRIKLYERALIQHGFVDTIEREDWMDEINEINETEVKPASKWEAKPAYNSERLPEINIDEDDIPF